MITLLSKIFIKDRDNVTSPAVRRAYGMLCGFFGIFLNVLLFAAKLVAGLISGSISVMADAFNNLGDAGSSVITLLGFKIAGQKPDSDHPFGHGRMEYISGLIVSMVIIVVGFELARSSLEKIVTPEPAEFSWLSVGILMLAIIVKLYMAFYNKSVGVKISSAAMRATATDSISDCVSTFVVLACTVVSHFTSLELDAYCGLVLSVFIMIAGVRAAIDTINPLLGQAPDKEFVADVEKTVMSCPTVLGIHDLIVHDYGPGRRMISLHAEVPCDGDILKIHDDIDNIEMTLRKKLGCDAVIHMDPIDSNDEATSALREKVKEIAESIDARMTIHDFRMVSGPTHTNLIFDAVVPFDLDIPDKELREKFSEEIQKLGHFFAVITFDRPFAEK
ncbi:MAG: cation transporter [Clostridiales bacterium]|nr:cation transporter [Clostridiales bacterium]